MRICRLLIGTHCSYIDDMKGDCKHVMGFMFIILRMVLHISCGELVLKTLLLFKVMSVTMRFPFFLCADYQLKALVSNFVMPKHLQITNRKRNHTNMLGKMPQLLQYHNCSLKKTNHCSGGYRTTYGSLNIARSSRKMVIRKNT